MYPKFENKVIMYSLFAVIHWFYGFWFGAAVPLGGSTAAVFLVGTSPLGAVEPIVPDLVLVHKTRAELNATWREKKRKYLNTFINQFNHQPRNFVKRT